VATWKTVTERWCEVQGLYIVVIIGIMKGNTLFCKSPDGQTVAILMIFYQHFSMLSPLTGRPCEVQGLYIVVIIGIMKGNTLL
jgi:hypothetical protein